jgi:cell division protein FtsX
VRSFAYISRKLALQRLKKYLAKTDAIDEGNLPLPPSFEIVVKARGDAPSIAKRFVNNPLVANDPGTNDGVGFGDFPTSP